MSLSRRRFLARSSKLGVAATASMLWRDAASAEILSSFSASDYKAVVLVSLSGGNDGNNTVVPLDASPWNAYSSIRPQIAIARGNLIPLAAASNAANYGLHPSLVNVASLYNQGRGMIVANIGSLPRPATKSGVLANIALFPGTSLSHSVGAQQWESSQATSIVSTGWGGRMADYLVNQSGQLPPVLSSSGESLFTVGKSVQAVAVQSGSAFPAIPSALSAVIRQIAQIESSSSNLLVQQLANVRASAMVSQQLIDQASSSTTLQTNFSTSTFSQGMRKIAQILAGRSVLGASRQMFYIGQGAYDHHVNQYPLQAAGLSEFDHGIGEFFAALDEIGLSNQVLVCTHSDFARSMQANTDAGTDHGWGNHHFVLGGGITGGRIAGTMPAMELGGSTDLTNMGVWIPTLSVVQMTAAIGQWMGLSAAQVSDVFPDLQNFPAGAIPLI